MGLETQEGKVKVALLEAAAALSPNKQFVELTAALAGRLNLLTAQLIASHDQMMTTRLQGRVQELSELYNNLTTAHEQLRKYKRGD